MSIYEIISRHKTSSEVLRLEVPPLAISSREVGCRTVGSCLLTRNGCRDERIPIPECRIGGSSFRKLRSIVIQISLEKIALTKTSWILRF